MIERFIAGVLRQKLVAFGVSFLVIVGGIVAIRTLTIDAFPDITPVRVEVDTDSPGLASEEVEKLVTRPIEVALQGIPDTIKIQSISKFGISVVTVYFEDRTDVYWARNQVFQQLSGIPMPSGISPEMGPNDTGTGQIFIYAVKSSSRSDIELRELQDWVITPALKTVPGVADNLSFGGRVKQYQLLIDPNKLKSYGLALDDVMNAVGKNNQNTGGNFVQHGGLQYIVRGIGLLQSVDEIGDIVVAARNGSPIYVKNLATVQIGPEVRQGAVSQDGKGEIVTGIAILRLGSNTNEVIQRVKAKLGSLRNKLPPDVHIEPIYDQSILIRNSISTVTDALIAGEILVILILFFLLSSFWASLAAAMAVPVCLLISLILMWKAGITANLLSLGGLAISIGMMIDASVVITENVYRNVTEDRSEHESVDVAVLRGARQVGRPVFFAIFIVIAAFAPLLALSGIEGKLFIPLALSIIFSMIGSVFMAFVLTPALCVVLLHRAHPEPANRLVRWLRNRYQNDLRASVDHPWRITVIWIAVTSMSVVLFMMSGSEFLPNLDENNVRVRATFPTSISLPSAMRIANQLEKILLQNPNVLHATSYVGRASLGGDPESVNNCEISLPLKDPDQWKGARSKAEVVEALRRSVERYPGVTFEFSQELEMRTDELISGFNTPIAIYLMGSDTNLLLKKADQVAGILKTVRGAADVEVEEVSGIDNLDIIPDRLAIARYGINVSDVMDVVQSAIGGTQAGTFYQDDRQFDIQVRMKPEYRNDVEAIRNLMVTSSTGLKIPLSSLARIEVHEGLAQIDRYNAQRRVVVKADVAGRSVGSVVDDARKAIDRSVSLPKGVTIEWGGAVEELGHALNTLYWAFPAALLLIFVLIYALFQSFRDSLVVLTTIPLAIVGGTSLLLILGLPISVPALIGYIANFGTEVQNGTIMVSFINRWRRKGLTVKEAAVMGASERLRPEILSALIGVLALIPFLAASGTGATVERPLAAVVIGGIALSRPLAWFLLPTLYVWFDRSMIHEESAESGAANGD